MTITAVGPGVTSGPTFNTQTSTAQQSEALSRDRADTTDRDRERCSVSPVSPGFTGPGRPCQVVRGCPSGLGPTRCGIWEDRVLMES